MFHAVGAVGMPGHHPLLLSDVVSESLHILCVTQACGHSGQDRIAND